MFTWRSCGGPALGTSLYVLAAIVWTAQGQDYSTFMTISGISPTRGSVAGGTRVTITGSGFNLDGREGSLAVYFGSTAAQCESYYQTDRQLVCYSPSSPSLRSGWQTISISAVAVDRGIQARCDSGNCKFYFDANYRHTPHVRDITLGGSAGDVFKYSGNLQTRDFEQHSARVGGFNCDVTEDLNADPDLILQYNGALGTVSCRVSDEMEPGRHNVSIVTSGEGGAAVQYRRTKQADPLTGEVWHFTSHPSVHSLSVSSTGTRGGALIRLEGTNFARKPMHNNVELAGVPCDVTAAALDGTWVECTTGEYNQSANAAPETAGRAPASPLPAAMTGSAPGLELVAGGRGWTRRAYSSYSYRPSDLIESVPPALEAGQMAHLLSSDEMHRTGFQWEGLFEAPHSGWYTFKFTRVDDDAWMYLSDDESPDNLRQIATMPWTSTDEFRYPGQRSDPIRLERGERRFCRVQLWEYGGKEYVSVGAEVELDEDVRIHPTALAHRGVFEVQEIKLSTDVQREVHRIEVRAPEGSSWRLKVLGSDGNEYSSAALKHDASHYDVQNAYQATRDGDNNVASGCYGILVSRDELVADDSRQLLAGHRYDITLRCATASSWRPVRPEAMPGSPPMHVFPEGKGSRAGVVQGASEPLSGSFRISIDGVQSEPLGFDAGNYDVEQALLGMPGIHKVVVSRYAEPMDGSSWRITFLGPHAIDVPDILVDGAGLLTGTNRSATCATLRHGSNRSIDYDPIPGDFMRAYLRVPLRFRKGGSVAVNGSYAAQAGQGDANRTGVHIGAVVVRSNGVLAACESHSAQVNESTGAMLGAYGCLFSYDASMTPSIASVSLLGGASSASPGSKLLIQGTGFVPHDRESGLDPQARTMVRFGTAECTVDTSTATQITCTMQGGSAGSFLPEVTVGMGRGRALVEPAVIPVQIEASVDSVSPSFGSSAGGALLTIKGSGFLPLEYDSELVGSYTQSVAEQQVVIGGKTCIALQASASEIVCVAPDLTLSAGASVNVSVGAANLAGGYTPRADRTPSVDSMLPTQLPSADTGDVQLQLSGLPTGAAAANLSVSFGSRECRVLSLSPAGLVTCELIRALPLQMPQTAVLPLVYVSNWGYAQVDETDVGGGLDTGFRIDGLSASSGGMAGGATVTITGHGFGSSVTANDVQFRSSGNNETGTITIGCDVQNVSDAQIVCQTRSVAPALAASAGRSTDAQLSADLSGEWVVSRNGIQAQSACGGSATEGPCSYTFRASETPQIHGVVFNATGMKLTVTGSGFSVSAGSMTVSVGEEECALLASPRALGDSSSLECLVPAVPAGTYPVRVRVEGKGFANASSTSPPEIIVPLLVTSIQPSTGSSQGGQRVVVHGSGFATGPRAGELNVVQFIGSELGSSSTKAARVLVQGGDAPTSTRLVIVTPAFNNAPGPMSADVRVRVLSDSSQGSSADGVQQEWQEAMVSRAHTTDVIDTAATPHLEGVTPENGEDGTAITLAGAGFESTMPAGSSVSVGGASCNVTAWSDTSISCSLRQVRAGVHLPKVTVGGKGLAFPLDIVTFTASHAVTGMDGAATGYGGGATVELRGKGFPAVTRAEASAAYALRDELIAQGRPFAAAVEPLPSVDVCGQSCEVIESTYNAISCKAPALLNAQALSQFNAEVPRVLTVQGEFADGELLEESMSSPSNAMDGDVATTAASNSAGCHIGMDLGQNQEAVLTRFAWYPDFWKAADTRGAVVEGSNDGSSWTALAAVDDDAQVLEGWNHIDVLNGPEGRQYNDLGAEDGYRYLRYRATKGHCRVNELEFIGIVRHTSQGACDVKASLPAGTAASQRLELDLSGQGTVQYSRELTPTFHAIEPVQGSALGGTNITIRGEGFGTDSTAADVAVHLNGVPCKVFRVTDTAVQCTTGPRDRIREPSVDVLVAGRGLAIGNSTVYFRYLDLWSARTTWAGNEPPVEGDTVIIPEGQAVLLDISPPRLFLILVQGELVFDRKDGLHLQSTYIWVHGGHFQIGEEDNPFTNKATVTLHGDRWSDIELPGIGAKTLSVSDRNTRNVIVPHRQRAILEIHGEPRKRSWTRLGATSEAGSDVIELQEPVDWRVGDRLFVTSSSGDYTHQEDVAVVEVLSPTRLRVHPPFTRYHRHQIFDGGPYGHSDSDLSAAVGLETRNVVIQGSGSELTHATQLFGGHTMAMGGGIYRIENAEVRRAGQAGILGRYPTHTHMAGAQAKYHYVKSLAVHDTNQRCATIHGSKYYTVFSIACTRVRGHSVFVEDGAEEWNVIDENLVSRTVKIFNGLKGDLKPASFWTASPKNIWKNNFAAGGSNDGAWVELPSHPHGPSYSLNLCPQHDRLGQFINNTATANGVHGLRIYPSYVPWKNPCNWQEGPPDMYETFANLTAFRNGGNGVFNKIGGAINIKHSKLMGNSMEEERRRTLVDVYGPPLHQPNSEGNLYVRDPDAPLDDSVVDDNVALFAPQDEYYYGKDLTFVGYGSGGAIAGCAKCDSEINKKQGGYTFRFSGLRFVSSAKRVRFTMPYKYIFQDDDGSLTGTAGGWATAYRAFNVWPGQCERREGDEFDGGIVCGSSVKVRRIAVDGFRPDALQDQMLALTVRRGTQDESWDVQEFDTKTEYGWVSPVVTTKHYDLSFRRFDNDRPLNIDLDWVRLKLSDPAYVDSDADDEWVTLALNRTYYAHHIRVRMPFDDEHQTVDPGMDGYLEQNPSRAAYAEDRSKYWERPPIGAWDGNVFGRERLPIPTDDMGTGFYNQSSNTWTVVLNNRNVTESSETHHDSKGDWNPHRHTKHRIEAKAMQCPPEGCDDPTVINVEGEDNWSSYFAGNGTRDDLVVPPGLRLIFDMSESPVYRQVRVEGEVVFLNDGSSRKLNCEHLLIFGRVVVGTEDEPWKEGSQAEIQLHSLRGEVDDGAVVDNDIYLDDKVIFVAGELLMHGQSRLANWARLAVTAEAGNSSIVLDRNTDLQPGDRLSITPTEWPGAGSDPLETEEAVVESVGSDGRAIVLEKPLEYRHFAGEVESGSSQTVALRAAVGLLTRNVRITGNMEPDGADGLRDTFGGHIVVSEMYGARNPVTGMRGTFQGRVDLHSVELAELGQGGMEHSALLLQFAPWRTETPDNPIQTLEGCSMHSMHNYVVKGEGLRNLVAKDNVFASIVKGGIYLDDKSVNATVDGNLVSGLFRAADETTRLARNRAAFFIDVEPRSLRGNVAGGIYDTGFTLRPTRCERPFESVGADAIRGNEAFAGKIGFFVLSTRSMEEDKCVYLLDQLAWKQAHVGVLTVDQTAHFRLDRITVSDSHIGFSPNFRRGGSIKSSYVVVQNSRFVGVSDANACDAFRECHAAGEGDAWGSKCNSVLGSGFLTAGILTAQFTNRGKTCTHDDEVAVCEPSNTPTRMCAMPWERRYGLPSTRHAEFHVLDTSFVGFGSGSKTCGNDASQHTKAIVSNPSQVDFFPPMKLRGIDWHDTEHAAKFHFFKRSGETKYLCVDQGCDSFGQVFVTDLDGSTVSSKRAGAHVLSGWDPGHAVSAPACAGVSEWRGIECGAGDTPPGASAKSYLKLVPASFDNLDRDRGFRLIGPVQVQREAAPSGEFRNTSAVGPIADPCALRFPFSQYPHVLETGVTNRVRFGGTLPGTLRAGYFSSDPNDVSIVKLFTQRPNAIEVFYNGRLVAPVAGDALPTLADPAGSNKFDPQSRHLFLVMRGGDPGAEYLIRRRSSVQLDLTLAVSVDEFQGDNVVQNLATLLSIPADRIKVVSVEAGSARIAVEILDEAESTLDQGATVQQVGRLVQVGASIKEALTGGQLDLGYPVEDAEVGISRPALEPPPSDEAMTSERGTVLPPSNPEVDQLLQSVMSNGFTDLAAPAVPLFAGENITYNNVTIQGYVDTNLDDVSDAVGVPVPLAADAPPVPGRNTTNRVIVPRGGDDGSSGDDGGDDGLPMAAIVGIAVGAAVALAAGVAVVLVCKAGKDYRETAPSNGTKKGDNGTMSTKGSKYLVGSNASASAYANSTLAARAAANPQLATVPPPQASGTPPPADCARHGSRVHPAGEIVESGGKAAFVGQKDEFRGENPGLGPRAVGMAGQFAGRSRGISDAAPRDAALVTGLDAYRAGGGGQRPHPGRAASRPLKVRTGGPGSSGRPAWKA